MKKIKLRVYLFARFLTDCIKYPHTPIENWQDMNHTYFCRTDDEMQELLNNLGKD